MDFIGQVILGGEDGGIDGHQGIHAGFLRSDGHLMDGALGRRGRRDENDQFRAMCLAEGTELLEARVRNGLELRGWGDGRLRLQERDEIFVMGNRMTENLGAKDAASVPEGTRMSE